MDYYIKYIIKIISIYLDLCSILLLINFVNKNDKKIKIIIKNMILNILWCL